MSADASSLTLAQMWEAINWLENKIELNWTPDQDLILTRAHAHWFEARSDIALSAKDCLTLDHSDTIIEPLLNVHIDWANSDAEAWLSAVRMCIVLANNYARRAVAAESQKLSDAERKRNAQRSYDVIMPLLNTSLDQRIEQLGTKRVLRAWGRAYANVSWAQREHDRARATDLLRAIADKVRRYPDDGELRNAASFAIVSVLSGADVEHTLVEETWHIAEEVFALPFSAGARDKSDANWLVGAVGALGMLAEKLDEPSASAAAQLMLDDFAQWPPHCYEHRSLPWAYNTMFRVLSQFFSEINNDRLNAAVLTNLTKHATNSTSNLPLITFADMLVRYPAWIIGQPEKRLHPLLDLYLQALRNLDAVGDITRFIPGLRILAEVTGENAVTKTWSAIADLPANTQFIWLIEVSAEPLAELLEKARSLADIHLRHATVISHQLAATLSKAQVAQWLKIVTPIIEQSSNDTSALRVVCDHLESRQQNKKTAVLTPDTGPAKPGGSILD